jgi:hypothetical protein
MRAQIEQAGKNVQACLEPAGAKASDIVLTRAYVTDADALQQNADMRACYLGSEAAASAVSAVPKLAAGPDFLVEIEGSPLSSKQALSETRPFSTLPTSGPGLPACRIAPRRPGHR